MTRVVVPEVEIVNGLEGALKLIRDDYRSVSDKTQSILYRFFDTVSLGRYNFFNQAEKILITDKSNPKHIIVTTSFDSAPTEYPSVHITLPSQSTVDNSIASGLGNVEPIFGDTSYRESLHTPFRTTYAAVIVSDNRNEVSLLFHFFTGLFLSLKDHFDLAKFRNIKIGGTNISIDQRIPPGVHSRSVTITFDYEQASPLLSSSDFVTDLKFNGTPVNQ